MFLLAACLSHGSLLIHAVDGKCATKSGHCKKPRDCSAMIAHAFSATSRQVAVFSKGGAGYETCRPGTMVPTLRNSK
eukprot:475778-Prorocentrum_minimum.AAC.1